MTWQIYAGAGFLILYVGVLVWDLVDSWDRHDPPPPGALS